MFFSPDRKKSAQEVLFSRKRQIQSHPTLSLVERSTYHKHLGVILDAKVKKGISVIKKLRHTLLQKSLLTIYKVFLRPLIDYGD